MIRVLHCADLHLDAAFSLRSPREAESRRTSLRADFTSMMMYVRSYKVQVCLISGDLFDSETVTADTKALMEREFASAPDCVFFLSPGNHDPLTPGSPYRSMNLPKNVHLFGAEKSCVVLEELGVAVYGFAFDGTNGSTNPVLGYPRKRDDLVNILCCHGDLEGGSSSPYCPFTREDLGRSGFDYVALGHIHKGTGLMCENGVYWAYPGCIEGRGFDETGEKGILLGEIGKGRAEMTFVPISKGRYEILEQDVTGCTRTEAAELVRRSAMSYGNQTTLRVILKGEVKEGLVILPEEISTGAEYPRWVEIIDRTVLAPDFTEVEQSNTLAGVFYRLMQQKIDCGEVQPEALKYGLLALDGRNVSDFTEE